MRRLFSKILIVLSAILIAAPIAYGGETFQVLTLRDDRLPSLAQLAQKAEELRDPFNWVPMQIDRFKVQENAGMEDTTFKGLDLTGIIWDKQTPMAIINNLTVKEGDSIGNVYVLTINKNEVTLVSGRQQHTLEFQEKIEVFMLDPINK
ncbi:MAG: hypothetical protein KKA70_01745 [Proteobacteria bacterium]|nr:hypothetical protein [Pseudomonadota bacterium]